MMATTKMQAQAETTTTALKMRSCLDPYTKCYSNLILMDRPVEGPIKPFLRPIRPRLTTFPYTGAGGGYGSACDRRRNCCEYALATPWTNYGCGGCVSNKSDDYCRYVTGDDLPQLYAHLLNQGYQVETQITNMMNSTLTFDGDTLVGLITWSPTPVNVTYIR